MLDGESKLMVSMVIGPRDSLHARLLWEDFASRTDRTLPELITTDEYAPYQEAILQTYGAWREHPYAGRGRPRKAKAEPPAGLTYAVVHKTRQLGRVVDVSIRRIFGSKRGVSAAVRRSRVSSHVNTSFIERFNATVRQHNSRKARKVYTFSKELEQHFAMSWFAAAYYNFCRPHLGLRVRDDNRWLGRTPAMASGITDHVWSIEKFMGYPLLHHPLCAR